jgi:hypothetical protein
VIQNAIKNQMKVCLSILLLLALALGGYAQNLQWAGALEGNNSEGISMAVDAMGNTYTVGIFDHWCDFDPGADTSMLYAGGSSDIYVLKLDAAGDFEWVRQIGIQMSPSTFNFHHEDLAVTIDPQGNVVVMGPFTGQRDLDPGSNIIMFDSWNYYNNFVEKLDPAGNLLWVKMLGSTGSYSDVHGAAVKCDQQGNIHTHGHFTGSLDFDPDPDSVKAAFAPVNNWSLYVSVLDSAGNFKDSVTVMPVVSDFYALSMALDGTGNHYLGGYYHGESPDFDPSPGVDTSHGRDAGYVMKLDQNLDYAWAKTMEGTGFTNTDDLAVDASNLVYAAGQFGGTIDFDPGTGTHNFTVPSSIGNASTFLLKLDSSGGFVSAIVSCTGCGGVAPEGMVVDSAKNVYFAGAYRNPTNDFDPGPGTHVLPYSPYSWGGYVQKLDSNNQFVWVQGFPVTGPSAVCIPNTLIGDDHGNLFLTGYFRDSMDCDPDTNVATVLYSNHNINGFVLKLGANVVIANEMAFDLGISIYPNPSHDFIMLQSSAEWRQESYTIYDVCGKKVTCGKLDGATTQLDVSMLAAGMYLLHVGDFRGMGIRFVKE